MIEKLLSLVPILVNIIAVVSFVVAMCFVDNIDVKFLLLVIPGLILPVIGFIYSFVIHKIFSVEFKPLWIIAYIINIIIFLSYGFGVFIFASACFIFSSFNFFCW